MQSFLASRYCCAWINAFFISFKTDFISPWLSKNTTKCSRYVMTAFWRTKGCALHSVLTLHALYVRCCYCTFKLIFFSFFFLQVFREIHYGVLNFTTVPLKTKKCNFIIWFWLMSRKKKSREERGKERRQTTNPSSWFIGNNFVYQSSSVHAGCERQWMCNVQYFAVCHPGEGLTWRQS